MGPSQKAEKLEGVAENFVQNFGGISPSEEPSVAQPGAPSDETILQHIISSASSLFAGAEAPSKNVDDASSKNGVDHVQQPAHVDVTTTPVRHEEPLVSNNKNNDEREKVIVSNVLGPCTSVFGQSISRAIIGIWRPRRQRQWLSVPGCSGRKSQTNSHTP